MPSDTPPFSPFLLLGMALRPLPLPLVERLASPLLRAAAKALEPAVADRLAGMHGRIAVIPSDLPFGLIFTFGAGLNIDLIESLDPPEAEAVIRAPVQVLLDLASGAGLDGDASFFTRSLTMEGDTGLCMAFRYALEDSPLSPSDLFAEASRLPRPLLHWIEDRLSGVGQLRKTARADVERLQASLLAPANARLSRLERDVAALKENIAETAARSRRRTGV